MEMWKVVAVNGFLSAFFAIVSYVVSTRKNKNDFLNNQFSIIETEIDAIRNTTYKLFKEIFEEDKSIDENLTYRLFTQRTNSLHNKILALSDLKKFSEDISEYNIFATNVIEAEDKESSRVHLDTFDALYTGLKNKFYQEQDKNN